MRSFLLICMICFTAAFASASNIPLPAPTGELTVQQAVEIALANSPALHGSAASIAAARARLAIAETASMPTVNLSGSMQRYSPVPGIISDDNDLTYNQYSMTLTGKYTLYDFGKTGDKVKQQEALLRTAEKDNAATTRSVVYVTKQAFFALLATMLDATVAREAVARYEVQLAKAKGFFEAGVKPKSDVTRAEVDLSQARLTLLKAESSVQRARVALNVAMGLAEAPDYTPVWKGGYSGTLEQLENLVARAYGMRPEVKSLAGKILAAEAALDLARKGDRPNLNLDTSYTKTGGETEMKDGWSVGLSMTMPLYNSGLTGKQAAEAAATLNQLKAQMATLRQTIFQEVNDAYLKMRDAAARIPVAERTVRLARENYEIAAGRYAAGVGNASEVTDAELSLTEAERTLAQAQYDVQTAEAYLQRIAGGSYE